MKPGISPNLVFDQEGLKHRLLRRKNCHNQKITVCVGAYVLPLWQACGEYRHGESSYGPFIRMLIITGQRRSEFATMRRAKIDLEKLRYTIPIERNKSGRTHDVPLSPQAIRIIKPRLSEEYVHIFPAARVRYAGIDTPDMIALDKPMSG